MTSKSVLKITSGPHEIEMKQGGTFHLTDVVGASENAIELTETNSLGQIGSSVGGMTVKPRDLTIIGLITSDVEVNRRWLLSCVVPGRMVRVTVEQNGEAYFIEGWPVQTPQIGQGDRTQDFNFKIRCPYPYWKMGEDVVNTFSSIAGAWTYPRTLDGTYTLAEILETNTKTIFNSGDVAVPVVVEMKDACKVNNDTTGLFLWLGGTLINNAYVRISTVPGQKEVTHVALDGTETNAFRDLTPFSNMSFTLIPGDNVISIEYATGSDVTLTAPEGVVAGV